MSAAKGEWEARSLEERRSKVGYIVSVDFRSPRTRT